MKRGWEGTCTPDEGEYEPIDHLVFVSHGLDSSITQNILVGLVAVPQISFVFVVLVPIAISDGERSTSAVSECSNKTIMFWRWLGKTGR